MSELKYTPEQVKQFLQQRAEHYDGMVRGVTVYKNGAVVVNREKVPTSEVKNWHSGRGEITALCATSRARMLFVAMATSIEFKSMITLTYPREYPHNGKVSKQHLNKFLRSLTERYGVQYYWFLEFNETRDAPHYHVLVTRPKVYNADRRWLALRWAECMEVSEGRRYTSLADRREHDMWLQILRFNTHNKAWEEIRKPDGARRYMAKYATKTRQKVVPENYRNCGRFYGYSRLVKASIKPLDTFSVDAQIIRNILYEEGHKVSEWDFLPKYLFGVSSFGSLTQVL